MILTFKVGGRWERTLRIGDYHLTWRSVKMLILIRKIPAPKMNPQGREHKSDKEKAGTWEGSEWWSGIS